MPQNAISKMWHFKVRSFLYNGTMEQMPMSIYVLNSILLMYLDVMSFRNLLRL